MVVPSQKKNDIKEYGGLIVQIVSHHRKKKKDSVPPGNFSKNVKEENEWGVGGERGNHNV